jgi:hypothetical protein
VSNVVPYAICKATVGAAAAVAPSLQLLAAAGRDGSLVSSAVTSYLLGAARKRPHGSTFLSESGVRLIMAL